MAHVAVGCTAAANLAAYVCQTQATFFNDVGIKVRNTFLEVSTKSAGDLLDRRVRSLPATARFRQHTAPRLAGTRGSDSPRASQAPLIAPSEASKKAKVEATTVCETIVLGDGTKESIVTKPLVPQQRCPGREGLLPPASAIGSRRSPEKSTARASEPSSRAQADAGQPTVEALAQLVKRECKAFELGKHQVQLQAKRRKHPKQHGLFDDPLHAWLKFPVQGVPTKRSAWLPALLNSMEIALRCCGLDLTLRETQELVVHVESGFVVHISFIAQ
mmetsp:Transcript_10058/g.22599  ORF Transcript_10058/g.22599 Transcript_10058/m.22599 type:complete len:274 (-) Transcript_10058:55-876(-)